VIGERLVVEFPGMLLAHGTHGIHGTEGGEAVFVSCGAGNPC
jgi:hypothetical protein